MRAISVLLANHHPVVRSNLRSLIEHEPQFKVVAEAANGREAVILADYKRPDVVVLEVDLSLWSGMDVSRTITSKQAGARILFYAPHTDESYVSAAFEAGARGYVAADSEQDDVIRAIRAVANGRRYISPAISRRLLAIAGCLPDSDVTLCCLIAAANGFQDLAPRLGEAGERRSFVDRLRQTCVPEVIVHSVAENLGDAAAAPSELGAAPLHYENQV